MKIALFDIDGTILRTGGAGRRAMEQALTEVFGASGPEHFAYDGKTDKQIVREAMRLEGFTDAAIDAGMPDVIARYLAGLGKALERDDHGAMLLPGVPAVLDAVERHDDIVLGLLTGNLLDGARHKLRAVGVDPDRFVIGAFGSDHEHRHALPAIARDRASAQLGCPVEAAACVIIGDTPNDVACTRPIGARAIGVATGRYSVEDLSACGADAVFANLSDTDAVVRAIVDA